MKIFFYLVGALGVTVACIVTAVQFISCGDDFTLVYVMACESFGLATLGLVLPYWGPHRRR